MRRRVSRRLIAIDLRAGEILWEKEASSLVGVSVGLMCI